MFVRENTDTQVVTTCWKSVHRTSGYQGYQVDIRGIINGCREKIGQISMKYLTDFSRMLKRIFWIYRNCSQISVDSGQIVKNLKNRWKQPGFGNQGYINWISANWISRSFVHRMLWVVTPRSCGSSSIVLYGPLHRQHASQQSAPIACHCDLFINGELSRALARSNFSR